VALFYTYLGVRFVSAQVKPLHQAWNKAESGFRTLITQLLCGASNLDNSISPSAGVTAYPSGVRLTLNRLKQG